MVLLAFYLQVYYISRYHVGYKHHQVIYFSQGFAFCGYIGYRYLFQ